MLDNYDLFNIYNSQSISLGNFTKIIGTVIAWRRLENVIQIDVDLGKSHLTTYSKMKVDFPISGSIDGSKFIICLRYTEENTEIQTPENFRT